jgi:hypothetical protein
VRTRPRVAFALFEASALLDLEIIADFDPIRLERINRFHKGRLSFVSNHDAEHQGY